MRASDDNRERVVAQLAAGYAQGSLGFDTLCHRIDQAYYVRGVEQLQALVYDLPRPAGLMERLMGRLGVWRSSPEARGVDLPLLSPPRGRPDRVLSLGRGKGCHLVLDAWTVSREHAELRSNEDGWTISDLGSRNGTFVNGWRIDDAQVLQPGDAIALADTRFVFAPAL